MSDDQKSHRPAQPPHGSALSKDMDAHIDEVSRVSGAPAHMGQAMAYVHDTMESA